MAFLFSAGCQDPVQTTSSAEREAMFAAYEELPQKIKGGRITPNWQEDGLGFWYTDPLTGETKTFLIDLAEKTGTFHPGPKTPQPGRPRPKDGEVLSPDFKWGIRANGEKVVLRDVSEGIETPLYPDDSEIVEWATDGLEGQWAVWSKDGSQVALNRRNFSTTPTYPYIVGTADDPVVEWVPAFRADNLRGLNEIFVLNTENQTFRKIDTGSEGGELVFLLGWHPSGDKLIFARLSIDFKSLEIIAVNPVTNASQSIFSEIRDTFHHFPRGYRPKVTFIENGEAFLWISDRDGWRHIYRLDMATGTLEQITSGETVVMEILGVDEREDWVYFTAHSDRMHPYDTHLNRVRLNGTGMEQITKSEGFHLISPSPTFNSFITTHWGLDLIPTSDVILPDGTKLATLTVGRLEVGEDFPLMKAEEFTVKAADGETDLYGVLYKPWDFDPEKKYPVIEIITGRPDIEINTILRFVSLGGESMAQLGFIVIAVDGRGTPGRSRAFHEANYGRIGGIEIDDHVSSLKALGAQRPYMDMERIGVVGGSFGGYYAIRAMLMAPETYKAGVALAPLDIRMDSVLQFMGRPEDNPNGYEFSSNITQAHKLSGKLLIIHGLRDYSVSTLYTFDLIRAFIAAGKPYDLLLLPDSGHNVADFRRGRGVPYALQAMRNYFIEHLKP